ncbi:type II toxin-antitoxin system VapC family toxin [Pelotomaculum propionicicum]|uniref:tRNA(fMet)-specific endonuclease VapC n=1 Tax=Pelotomaculum propionicicum TaxID=258475 RepID=A0A4Y7RW63_9FIRM|nr:type II toxin-antitoxin system VapC family toxin [Pelotomaculum propionicicum]NLI12433.1 type II toxin-antitoxin system VapC family toxin [Peptococcaceae bacterium]TEB13224.1 tRNA(fMet)-specific endonuclease VapC [Pelotomaculum propionicicum]
MILVDSCGWIEFLADGDKAEEYSKYLLDTKEIATPTIVIYEVFKKVLQERGEESAVMVAAQMSGTRVIELSETLSLTAANLSIKHSLPMADAIVYATAELLGSQVVTSDKHFKDLENVIFI